MSGGGASAAAPGPDGGAGQAQPPPSDTGGDRGTADHRDTPRPDHATDAQAPAQPAAAARPTAGSHADFLITSDERDAAEARLRHAVADEVLSLEEFGDRMRMLLAARTRGELHAAVAGLPAIGEPQVRTTQRGHAQPARRGGSAYAIMSSAQTKGRWQPDGSTTAVAVMGEAVIDLQGIEFEGDELVISAFAAMGEVVVIVPEGVAVDMQGIAIMGDRVVKVDDGAVLPGAPVVRIEGLAFMGQITVRHPKPRERYASVDGRGAFADRVPLTRADTTAVRREQRTSRMARVRRWAGALLAAAVVAVPVGWTLSADDVAGAVFGSATQTVTASDLEAGDVSVGAPVAFGSVEVRVPEGVNVERDGLVVFGSTNCDEACAGAVADAPTVQVRSFGAFGSVDITPIPSAGAN